VLQRRGQQSQIGVARNLDSAELRQVAGDELRIQKPEPTELQARDEMGQRHLAGVALAAEHAFAEERRADLHAIEPADQRAIAPAFHRMGMPHAVKRRVKREDLIVDPAFASVRRGSGAKRHDIGEDGIDFHREAIAADGAGETLGKMEPVERKNAPRIRRHPEEIGIIAPLRHGKYPGAIGLEEEFGGQARRVGEAHRGVDSTSLRRPVNENGAGYRKLLAA